MSTATVAATQPAIAQPVISFVLANFAEEIELDDLANAAGMSRFAFSRKFHRECGVPPMRWLWSFRTMLAAEFIELDPDWSMTDIAFSCGFSSSAHFSRSFRAVFGVTPSRFRREASERLKQAGMAARAETFDGVFSNNESTVRKAAELALKAS